MKYKGSTKKLTRLILAALFLNSSIYLPMAGAQEYNVPSDDSDSSKMTKTSADFQYMEPAILPPITEICGAMAPAVM